MRFDPTQCTWITSLRDDEIAGVTVFSHISRWKCELSCASVRTDWLTKEYLRAVFRYVFVQCGMTSVFAVSEAHNKQGIEFNIRIGFRPKSILEDWFGDTDGVLLYMQSSNCRWIDEKPITRADLVYAS